MKTVLIALLTLTASAPAFALVALKADCTTSDGKYQVHVYDNQGIGPDRSTHLGASVQDRDGKVMAAFPLIYDNPRIRSISFGTSTFEDTNTLGRNFSLTTGSTNFGPHLRAKLDRGGKIDDARVDCHFYGLDQLPFNK